MKHDYAKGRFTAAMKEVSRGYAEEQIREACAKAIADTRRAERRRAARILKKHESCGHSTHHTEELINEILGVKGRRDK